MSAMEVSLLASNGISDNAILSVRAGTVRRQAPINSGRPFRFPKISMEENPIKIDVLQQIGTAYLVLKPNEAQYKVSFGDNKSMACELEVKKLEGASPVEVNEDAGPAKESAASAKDAKEYLESHQILQFVQAVLQTVIKERPSSPYEYMAKHFMGGYDPADVRASKQTAKKADPASEPQAPPQPPSEKPAEMPKEDAAAKAEPPKAEPAAEAPAAEAKAEPLAEEKPADAPAPEKPAAEEKAAEPAEAVATDAAVVEEKPAKPAAAAAAAAEAPAAEEKA
eukprot:CAMPEP_0195103586 /NCGR_PEP_ID=MMETSP0448-20130528/72602_1 /TAXON_ID=66468 /ORGANISM="Heterocapsa triquestra, Strain CCMP 448" /LENGTH=280 /DNA_ID=CAMNT_0040139301 /DNA_START=80 /DNA_END=919 /DNA_ORIENTATION=-